MGHNLAYADSRLQRRHRRQLRGVRARRSGGGGWNAGKGGAVQKSEGGGVDQDVAGAVNVGEVAVARNNLTAAQGDRAGGRVNVEVFYAGSADIQGGRAAVGEA